MTNCPEVCITTYLKKASNQTMTNCPEVYITTYLKKKPQTKQ